jgi:hypothetical protein
VPVSDDLSSAAERALWLSVIQEAILDATTSLPASSRRDRVLERDAARSWLLHRNRDFATVCALAGVDPDWMRNRARKIIEKSCARPKRIRVNRLASRGEGENFSQRVGTGPGSVARDRTEMEFS